MCGRRSGRQGLSRREAEGVSPPPPLPSSMREERRGGHVAPCPFPVASRTSPTSSKCRACRAPCVPSVHFPLLAYCFPSLPCSLCRRSKKQERDGRGRRGLECGCSLQKFPRWAAAGAQERLPLPVSALPPSSFCLSTGLLPLTPLLRAPLRPLALPGELSFLELKAVLLEAREL